MRESFPRADVERHAGPAPVVDVELEREVRLDVALGRDALLLPVAGNLDPADLAACVSPPNDDAPELGGIEWPDRPQRLHLLVADRVGVERSRWFHRRQRQHLEEVVLEDVAQRSGCW